MRVKINTHGNPLPERKGDGDWWDVSAAETVHMKIGEMKIIPLGISVEVPKGYLTYILPRSSTVLKHKILMGNSMGVIDNAYNGDDDVLGFIAYAIEDTTIEKGTRIGQMAIYAKPADVNFVPVDSLGNENRGGYGSTGTK